MCDINSVSTRGGGVLPLYPCEDAFLKLSSEIRKMSMVLLPGQQTLIASQDVE